MSVKERDPQQQARQDSLAKQIHQLVWAATTTHQNNLKHDLKNALEHIDGYVFDGDVEDLQAASAFLASAMTVNTDIALSVTLAKAWVALHSKVKAERLAFFEDIELLSESLSAGNHVKETPSRT